MADRQALGAAREMHALECLCDDDDDAGHQEAIDNLAEIISKHYSAKLEAAQKMAEALRVALITIFRHSQTLYEAEQQEYEQAENALKEWRGTL